VSRPVKLTAKTAEEIIRCYGVDVVFEVEHLINLTDPRAVAEFYLRTRRRIDLQGTQNRTT
jgi:hypothetical protein